METPGKPAAPLPSYLQMVYGLSATQSGLLLTPLLLDLLTKATSTAPIISRSRRYRIYPVAGSLVMALALGLLGTLEVSTPLWLVCSYVFLIGAGLGFVMQIVVLVVQNSGGGPRHAGPT